MSGTQKLGKFGAASNARDPKGSDQGANAQRDITMSPDDGVDLPARPFEPMTDAALLPSLPFTPRTPAHDATPAEGHTLAPIEVRSTESPGEWIPPQVGDSHAESLFPSAAEGDKELAALRTRLTQKFVSLADSVTDAFHQFSIGAGNWGVELTAPQGMSTGGGKQALQHLRLRPRRPGYSVLVGGTVNLVEKRAELRDFDHITIMHEVRFRSPLEITTAEWEQFLRKAEVVLNAAGIQSMRTPPPRELLEQRRSLQRISRGALAMLVVVLILAAIVMWRVVVALTQ